MHAEPIMTLLPGFEAHELKHAPDELWLAGDKTLLTEHRRVAVVGSRKASPEALARARAIARELVERDIIVVSGLAEGIDTAAHKAAIEADGRTVAVLGTPLSTAYPASNAGLLDTIKRDHLAVSQFAEGHPVLKDNFPRRNRTMALLSDATIVVDATETSGTRHQAWEALRLNRSLFLLENVATNSDLTWPAEMIEYGAEILNRDTIGDMIDMIVPVTHAAAMPDSAFEVRASA